MSFEGAIVGAANGAALNADNFSRAMVTAVESVPGGTLVTIAGLKMIAIAPAPAVGDWVIYSRNPPFCVGKIAGA